MEDELGIRIWGLDVGKWEILCGGDGELRSDEL